MLPLLQDCVDLVMSFAHEGNTNTNLSLVIECRVATILSPIYQGESLPYRKE